MSRATGLLLWVLAAVSLLVFPLVPSAAGRDVVQSVVIVTALGVAWRHLLRHRDLMREGWLTLLVAVSTLGLSDLVLAVEMHLLGYDESGRLTPWLALLGYVILGVGIVQFQRNRSRRRPLPGKPEAVIFALGALTPLLVFLIIPVLQDDGVSAAHKATTVAFALVDLAGLTVVLRGVLTDARQSPSLVLLGGALLSALAAASWAGMAQTGPTIGVRVLFLLAFVLFAAGVAHPSIRMASHGAPWTESVPSRRWIWLMGAGQAMPLVTLGVVWYLEMTGYELLITLGGLGVSLLVLSRMAGFLKRIREQSDLLASLARSDDLTGLHNRRSWGYELKRACSAAEVHGDALAIGLIDLDRFKAYNDTHGHLAGDEVLRDAAASWRQMLHPSEVLARYGGEEFAVILPGCTLEEAVARLDDMRVSTPHGQTFSAGVALWVHGTDPVETLAEADDALYRAKSEGRNRVIALERGSEDLIASALERLEVVLQPIFRVDDMGVAGFEVLSRFSHSDEAGSVLAHAHALGYGDRLETAAIGKALELPGRPPGVRIFVKVSELAMRTPRFWQELSSDLTDVVVELHEGRTGLDDVTVGGYLDRLRSRGARVGLDDVGNRATDLPRIAALRPDVVKIDRSLVRDCHRVMARADVLRDLATFARRRGADVCADGVETEEELAVVVGSGANLVQGLLLGAPQPGWVAQSSRVSSES
jgi:diguanylate cyclase (GGDEF)-like protein